MSIGEVTTDLDDPFWDFTKGDRRITVADTTTWQTRVIDMRDRLDAYGRNDLSDAVRPAVFTPDESKLYFQVSFFNGFLEYDVATDRITRVKTLPMNPDTNPDRTTWVNDSRHHGMSMSPDGSKLCVAGTVDNYATIVDRASLQEGPLVTASQAVLGHRQRRRPGLRDLRVRRGPGQRDQLRHRRAGRQRRRRRPPAAGPRRPRPRRLERSLTDPRRNHSGPARMNSSCAGRAGTTGTAVHRQGDGHAPRAHGGSIG